MSGGYIGLDYVPEMLLEEENDVTSGRVGFQANDRFNGANDRLTLLGRRRGLTTAIWITGRFGSTNIFASFIRGAMATRRRIRGAITLRRARAGNTCRPPHLYRGTFFLSARPDLARL